MLSLSRRSRPGTASDTAQPARRKDQREQPTLLPKDLLTEGGDEAVELGGVGGDAEHGAVRTHEDRCAGLLRHPGGEQSVRFGEVGALAPRRLRGRRRASGVADDDPLAADPAPQLARGRRQPVLGFLPRGREQKARLQNIVEQHGAFGGADARLHEQGSGGARRLPSRDYPTWRQARAVALADGLGLVAFELPAQRRVADAGSLKIELADDLAELFRQ